MLTLMTWNIENLFLPGSPSGPKTQQIYDAKLAGLAAKISAIKPEVIGLQEVGDTSALDELVTLLGGNWQQEVV